MDIKPVSVLEYLEATVEQYPDKIAFRDEHTSVTFSEFRLWARKVATSIIRIQNDKTTLPIAVYLPKCVECLVAFFAAIYSGNFYTPLDISAPKVRTRKIIEVLDVDIILTISNLAEDAKEIAPEAKIICVDNTVQADDELLYQIQQKIIDTDPLYVLFTSGSTGLPKGVVISHRAMIDFVERLTEVFDFNTHTIFGTNHKFYFDSSGREIYSTIRNGCEMYIVPENLLSNPIQFCKTLEANGVNTLCCVPSLLVNIANSKALEEYAPHGLKMILFVGEIMPTKQLNIWRKYMPHVQYYNVFGPTELTDIFAYYRVNRALRDDEPIPMGAAFRNVEIFLLDENNIPVSDTDIGELCVRGTCLAHGYYRNHENTSVAFIQNPLNNRYPELIYKTGDLARYNNYGELVFVGRKDNQIQHMGYRVELGEIEAAANAFPETKSCCAVYDENKSRIILAVMPEDIDKSELYKYMNSILPRYMMPGRVSAYNALPLNANGKIDRKEVLAMVKSLRS